MNIFNLEIISPSGTKYKGEVNSLTAMTKMGQVTILPGHQSLFSVLEPGELTIRSDRGEEYYSLGSWFLEVTKAKVLVLADKALHADELEEKEIESAQAQAAQILKEKPKGEIQFRAQNAFRRSLIDLKIARKRKKHQSL